MKWKLHYLDGTTFSSEDGEWADAPHLGALVLATEDPDVGRELDHGARGEFFAWMPEAIKPWGFDRVGILSYLLTQGYDETTKLADLSLEDWKEAGVKVGENADNHVFREVLTQAIEDEFLPMKSATSNREAAV